MTDDNKYSNIRCPFCGKKVIHVYVCDDEENIHGSIGCEYESDPWSGLGYVLIHEGWGECILCTDDDQTVIGGGIIFDTPDEALEALKLKEKK